MDADKQLAIILVRSVKDAIKPKSRRITSVIIYTSKHEKQVQNLCMIIKKLQPDWEKSLQIETIKSHYALMYKP